MLIDGHTIKQIATQFGYTIKGIVHIGAHLCEERGMYNTVWNLSDEAIVWIEAIPSLVEHNTRNGNRCYSAVLDEVSRPATFYVTNNGQSSSLLELGTHKTYYPDIVVNRTFQTQTQTLVDFFTTQTLSPESYNVWNLDIQGTELSVLKGAASLLPHVDMIYTEVNAEELYKDCCTIEQIDAFLREHGFMRILTKMMPEQWGDALYIRVKV